MVGTPSETNGTYLARLRLYYEPRLAVMTDHEVSALAFAHRERQGLDDSLAPLRAFLSRTEALSDAGDRDVG